MKKLLIVTMMVFAAAAAIAAEKKPIQEVDSDELTTETQVAFKGARDEHIAFIWWVPNEFWQSVLSRDTTIKAYDKKALLNTISKVSLLAVVQADVTEFGSFEFYSKEEVEESMLLSFIDSNGKKQALSPLKVINPDVASVVRAFKPILSAAMGELGNNMHFYVLKDRANSARVIDPYSRGELMFQLAKKDNSLMHASLELPLNALFIPRKCPNGQNAHISWKYCPWSGEELED